MIFVFIETSRLEHIAKAHVGTSVLTNRVTSMRLPPQGTDYRTVEWFYGFGGYTRAAANDLHKHEKWPSSQQGREKKRFKTLNQSEIMQAFSSYDLMAILKFEGSFNQEVGLV